MASAQTETAKHRAFVDGLINPCTEQQHQMRAQLEKAANVPAAGEGYILKTLQLLAHLAGTEFISFLKGMHGYGIIEAIGQSYPTFIPYGMMTEETKEQIIATASAARAGMLNKSCRGRADITRGQLDMDDTSQNNG